jgi:hypothetical protein
LTSRRTYFPLPLAQYLAQKMLPWGREITALALIYCTKTWQIL